MAEPQAHSATEHARAKGAATPSGAPSEPRSFERGDDSGMGAAARSAEVIAQATQPLVDGGRQMAEQGRKATRQVSEAWRQAFDPLLAMQFEMGQWFDEMFRHSFGFRASPATQAMRPFGGLGAHSLFGLPPVDLKETDNAHLLAVELPGLAREDVDLSIVGDTLVVCGHKAEESDDAAATYRVSERRYGRFERAFPLPADVDRTRIAAQFRDGVLKITLPKNPEAAPQRARIEIKS